MSSFKIETVKLPQLLHKTLNPVSDPPQFSLAIDSLVCLNYPIEILGEIIEAHFE